MLASIFLSLLMWQTAIPVPSLIDLQQEALQEEVNVLVYGVIQFSQALHNLYNSMAQKLDKIRQRMDFYQQNFKVLYHQVQSIQLDRNENRERIKGLKAEGTILKQQAQAKREELQELLVDHQNMLLQVKLLEEKLSSMDHQDFQNKEWELATMRAHVQQQNFTIWFLLEAAKQQQEQMAEQEKKLLWIQEKGKTR
ncbi:golgin subfamily A member 6-like protein 6 isoform X1 [Ahaetulla prasina]|uniref:golgin subfamily A member 6-like protein 6 isoform X1 n=1 Tax=Ahaetulla prasina TaxID=499056 RepID=UPI00264A0837|nr:golgin subfamily A member 6-like protein 6 isoform X1 [Ahaetulla prasina]